jgi:hypothetical protein
MAAPLQVAVTGAAGQIAYSLLPHICLGRTFGMDRPISLRLLDIERAQKVGPGQCAPASNIPRMAIVHSLSGTTIGRCIPSTVTYLGRC